MTGERVAVTSNGREYTWRGTRWTYEPKNNHGRTEVHRTSRLHFALCELASLRAQVTALAGEKEDAARWRYVRDNGYVTTMTVDLPDKQRVFAGRVGDAYATACVDAMMALDAARGGEG